MRVLFAGTPDFSVPPLRALLSEHEIVGVYTQPDRQSGRGKKVVPSPVKQVALEQQLPLFQPQTLGDEIETIEALKPDVFVVVAFGMLLPQTILDIPKLGCINIHASILPRWRGAAPIQRAIEAGDTQSGVSIMQMEAGLDTGPVFEILATDIGKQDTSQDLHDRLAALGAIGITQTLDKLQNALDTKKPIQIEQQNDDLATYAKKITKQEAQIDWRQEANQIQCRVRAFNPWPVCQTHHNDTRLRIWRSSLAPIVKADDSILPGQVIAIDEEGISVACRTSCDYAIKLEVLQRDGSKPLTSQEFLNGYTINLGDIFSPT